MVVHLNAFPLSKIESITACKIPYDQEQLLVLRNKYSANNIFLRNKNNILIFSINNKYPINGEIINVDLNENINIFFALIRQALIQQFIKFNRHPVSYNPIELISRKRKDLLATEILGENYPFQLTVKYILSTKLIRGTPNLVIDCSIKQVVKENLLFFLKDGFSPIGLYAVSIDTEGKTRRVGEIVSIAKDVIEVLLMDGSLQNYSASSLHLEANSRSFYSYLTYTHKQKAESIIERIRKEISLFSRGPNKKQYINNIIEFIKKEKIQLINGSKVHVYDAFDIHEKCKILDSPTFVFNDNREEKWVEKGLNQYGPYTRRTFDRHNPSICVICNQYDKGRIEQFVRKFLKGIVEGKYFKAGFEGKFNIGTSRIEFFTTFSDSPNAYKMAIEDAIRKKSSEGGQWSLALIQVKQSFKKLDITANPYYLGKSLFFLHQIPVQDFTLELTRQNDSTLSYSLNNMALACYAKMGGIPWLLKASPTLSHELVIGIGSATINSRSNLTYTQRVMGITTVFSGDGSYIVSNTSKAVAPDDYCQTLTIVLTETIKKIEQQMNWQEHDTIRLVFHASVKKFNKDEINAVKAVFNLYQNYHIEYTFLKVSDNHGLHLFDSATENEKKGKLAPPRGKFFQLSHSEMLIYLIGYRELKQESDGHPQGVLIEIHPASTFKDINYLSRQVYNFSSHSWRSYFPNPMPVTISYSDLIARNLGWLNQLPGWNDSTLIGKIGQTQWFL